MSGVPFIDGTKIVSFLTRSLVTIETTLRSLDETESREFSRHMETLIDTVRAVGMTDEKWAELVNEARGIDQKPAKKQSHAYAQLGSRNPLVHVRGVVRRYPVNYCLVASPSM